MKCDYCNTELKVLLTSTYCPNECRVTKNGLIVQKLTREAKSIPISKNFSWKTCPTPIVIGEEEHIKYVVEHIKTKIDDDSMSYTIRLWPPAQWIEHTIIIGDEDVD